MFNRTKIVAYLQGALAKPKDEMAYEVFSSVSTIFDTGARFINHEIFETFVQGLARYFKIFKW